MAHFYGILDANRGRQSTRCGTRNLGLETIAASWKGAVRVMLYHEGGKDRYRVVLTPWNGVGPQKELAEGAFEDE